MIIDHRKEVGHMSEFIGYTDLPIENLSEDKFNVGQYVEGLGKFILECDTPMTISIQGDWGSGKTSVMKMIQNNLGEKILPIWFNTWQFSQFNLGNSLAISMIDILLKKLDGDTKILSKITGGMFSLTKNFLISATELTAGSNMGNKLKDFIENFSVTNCVDEIDLLKKNFEETVEKKLNSSKKSRIVVFVDDLDRLEPLKAIELLEVLKLFLDCKNCIFVLAVDYEIVTLGIRQKYGDTINAAKGKSFFEKIIQLPFKMPVANYDIEKYTDFMMKKMKIDDDVKLFSDLIKNSIGLNPRGMKRLFNTYRLLSNILPPLQDASDKILQKRILFAAVCMQMGFETVYDYFSAGNIDVDILKKMSEIDEKSAINFLNRRSTSENTNFENFEDDILESFFDEKISIDELHLQLQKFPTFVKNFLDAIHKNSDGDISEREVKILQDIIKSSAITGVTPPGKIPPEIVVERRQKNRETVAKVNDLLSKKIGKFKIPQKNPADTMSTATTGYFIFDYAGEKYQFRYDLDSNENKFLISVCIGSKQDAKKFFEFMGENPLEYQKIPETDEKRCEYFYNDIFEFDMNDKLVVGKIFGSVDEAYRRLKKFLESKTKK